MKITIDRAACMGSGNCSFYAPHTFALGDDLVAYVMEGQCDPASEVRLAAEGCPVHAITVEDD